MPKSNGILKFSLSLSKFSLPKIKNSDLSSDMLSFYLLSFGAPPECGNSSAWWTDRGMTGRGFTTHSDVDSPEVIAECSTWLELVASLLD